MRPPQEKYDSIPSLPPKGVFFQHFPGVYCKGCGETFALYSYSFFGSQGEDENGKPYMTSCFKCRNKPEVPSFEDLHHVLILAEQAEERHEKASLLRKFALMADQVAVQVEAQA